MTRQTETAEKTITELLADIGIRHERAKRGNGLHNLYVGDAFLDSMDAHGAVLFLQTAECAA